MVWQLLQMCQKGLTVNYHRNVTEHMSKHRESGRYPQVRDERPLPPTSLILATTVLSYPHSPSICVMPANHLAATETKLLFISENKKKKGDEPSLSNRRLWERCSKKLLVGWLVSKPTVGIWGKFEDCIVMSTHPDRARIWLYSAWQVSDFSPPTAAWIRESVVHTYTHTVKEVEKNSKCHERNTSSAFTLSLL